MGSGKKTRSSKGTKKQLKVRDKRGKNDIKKTIGKFNKKAKGRKKKSIAICRVLI